MFLLRPSCHHQVDENYDQSEERTEEPTDGSEIRVWGNMVAFVERLDDEMFKSLQVGLGPGTKLSICWAGGWVFNRSGATLS